MTIQAKGTSNPMYSVYRMLFLSLIARCCLWRVIACCLLLVACCQCGLLRIQAHPRSQAEYTQALLLKRPHPYNPPLPSQGISSELTGGTGPPADFNEDAALLLALRDASVDLSDLTRLTQVIYRGTRGVGDAEDARGLGRYDGCEGYKRCQMCEGSKG